MLMLIIGAIFVTLLFMYCMVGLTTYLVEKKLNPYVILLVDSIVFVGVIMVIFLLTGNENFIFGFN